MKVTIHTADGTHVEVEHFDDATIMDLTEALSDPEQRVLVFDLDTGPCYVVKAHVVRIDVEDAPSADA